MNKKEERKEVSVEEFIEVLNQLPANELKELWIDWLKEYEQPGYYDRLPNMGRNAKYAYNHLANPDAMLWLLEVAGVDTGLIDQAKLEYIRSVQKNSQAAAIRKVIPWDILESALWKSN